MEKKKNKIENISNIKPLKWEWKTSSEHLPKGKPIYTIPDLNSGDILPIPKYSGRGPMSGSVLAIPRYSGVPSNEIYRQQLIQVPRLAYPIAVEKAVEKGISIWIIGDLENQLIYLENCRWWRKILIFFSDTDTQLIMVNVLSVLLIIISLLLIVNFIVSISNIYINELRKKDVPIAWGLYFQEGASPSFEGIVDLHNRIMFYLVVILFGVTWIMLSIMWNFNKSSNTLVYRYLNHGTLIELIWTVGPALVLVAIAFPSFKLLYLMDKITLSFIYIIE